MAYTALLPLTETFSGFGSRLTFLEGIGTPPPIAEIVQFGLNRLGADFRTKGPRFVPVKTPLTTGLPVGASLIGANQDVITTANTSVVFEGWDLSGFSLYLTQGNVTLRDTRMARGDANLIDRRGASNLIIEWCDLDGLRMPWTSTMIINNTNSGFMSVADSKVHGSGVDLISISSNFSLDRCWVYDGGYTADEFFHFDGMQLRTSAAAYSNIMIRDCLLDIIGPRDAASAIRLVTENSATLTGVTITGNVINRSLSVEDVPIAVGAKPGGGEVSNVVIANNWLRYGTPDPIYPYAVPSGQALWQNNRQLVAGTSIAVPAGWSA